MVSIRVSLTFVLKPGSKLWTLKLRHLPWYVLYCLYVWSHLGVPEGKMPLGTMGTSPVGPSQPHDASIS